MSIRVRAASRSAWPAIQARPIGPPKSCSDEVDALDPERRQRGVDEGRVAGHRVLEAGRGDRLAEVGQVEGEGPLPGRPDGPDQRLPVVARSPGCRGGRRPRCSPPRAPLRPAARRSRPPRSAAARTAARRLGRHQAALPTPACRRCPGRPRAARAAARSARWRPAPAASRSPSSASRRSAASRRRRRSPPPAGRAPRRRRSAAPAAASSGRSRSRGSSRRGRAGGASGARR